MLTLSRESVKALYDAKNAQIVALIEKRNIARNRDIIAEHVQAARGYGLGETVEIVSYVESTSILLASGYEFGAIRALMERQDLSADHKLIPLRMLRDAVLARGPKRDS